MPNENLPEENRKAISELQVSTSVLDTKVDNLTSSINRIETNHLVHLKDEVDGIAKDLKAFTGKVYEKLNDLALVDASSKPGQDLFRKIIEYVILAVVGAVIALVVTHSL